jgi:3-deoxy-D-manno-octulosonic-acid transferase
MYLAYSLLLTLGLLVLIPHFIYQAIAHGKYVEGLGQRLGKLEQIHKTSRPVIWLHCVSVGETQAARPLVKKLRDAFPEHALVVSTITATGQKLARQVFEGEAESVFYFPFDWRWTVRRALNAVNPELVLIMETELWPNFLRECSSRNIPIALVNGRISRQSFRRYRLVRFFLVRILAHLNMAVMQSKADGERIVVLGLDEARLFTAGNLKFDVSSLPSITETTETLRQRFRFAQGDLLILAASTHAPEEKVVIETFQKLRLNRKLRLMIAPRHPERFNEAANCSKTRIFVGFVEQVLPKLPTRMLTSYCSTRLASCRRPIH